MKLNANAQEHGLGIRPALFADDQDFGAGCSLGVGEYAVLLDDEGPRAAGSSSRFPASLPARPPT